jgi:hypothetical protein
MAGIAWVFFVESSKGPISYGKFSFSVEYKKAMTKLNNLTKDLSGMVSSSPIATIVKTVPARNTNLVQLQKVNNVGYSFYLSQVDYSNTPPLNDGLKNDITQVIYKSKVPKKLLNDVAIIVVNTLAATPDKKIVTPYGQMSLPDFPPVFLSGGGLYSKNYNQMSLIFINSRMVDEASTEVTNQLGQLGNQLAAAARMDFLSRTLTHELAHYVGSQLTPAEWAKYFKLRNIPSNTPANGQTWETSPLEDFAEVYRNTVTGLDVRTSFGFLEPKWSEVSTCQDLYFKLTSDFSSSLPKKYKDYNEYLTNYMKAQDEFNKTLDHNQQIQDCRRDAMLHPEKYPESKYDMGPPYKSSVDQPTKDFINGIINRLNQ